MLYRSLGLILFVSGALHAQAVLETVVKQSCSGCHNDKLRTAGVSLVGVSSSDVAGNAGVLEKVYRKVRAGEMPPVSAPRLPKEQTAALLAWLETSLDANGAAHPNPGAPAIHRLNRAEYRNAIRDLLAIETPEIGSDLPADDSGYGFDNIGDVLSVSPLHMERYLASARRIAQLAMGTLKASVSIQKYTSGRTEDQLFPLNQRAGLTITRYFPFDAEYSILVRGRGAAAPGMPAPKLDVRIDGKRLKLIDADMDTEEANQGTRNFDLRVSLTAGPHDISAAMLTEYAHVEAGGRGGATTVSANNAGVEYLTIGGPYNVKGPGEPESRKRLLVCGRTDDGCARRVLENIARRAYRRPVTAADVDPLMQLFATGKKDGGDFDHGIEMALTGVLVSPNFLYRVEQTPQGVARGASYRVTDLDLASRLSFFLWSSIPDEELLRTATESRLHEPAVLKAQVRRMLADAKSYSLVDNFVGQWLQLRNVASWKPDPDKYPGLTDGVRASFEQETELFFENMVRENRSILELIDSDYTFVNDTLARYYGIANVRGSYFRKVAVNPAQRGGVLTDGSVLMVTSYPTRTSPVLRGKWILENILGTPPPPPPPNVPPLSDDAQISAASMRELLAKHRANAVCAGCHSRLDPLGFSLENFDAVGKYRATDNGQAVDALGTMPDGTEMNGARGLKDLLLARKDEFVECFAEKLLTYALGRGLEDYDRPVVRDIRRRAAREGYQFDAVVDAIVDSVPFQMRKAP